LTQRWWFRFDLDLRSSLGRRTYPNAVVVQEDRNLVMGPQATLDLDAADDLDAAYLAVLDHRPIPLGGYLLRRGRENGQPWTYQAVVHDFELAPSCRPGDVRRSLCGVVRDAQRRGLGFVAAEPLGRWNGRGLSFEEMTEAFHDSILELSPQLDVPFRLTLMLDELDEVEQVSNLLRSRLLRRASRSFRTVDGDAAVVEVRDGVAKYHFRFVPGTLSGYMVTRGRPGA
jgi:hypothetical protein